VDRSSSEQIADLLPARYALVRTLRANAAGGTLLVLDSGLRHEQAVLKYQRLVGEGGSGRPSFLDFLGRIGALNDPLVATPYTGGVLSGADGEEFGYFVRAFVHGIPLSAISRPLSVESVVHAALQLARGLESLHRASIVHADLKPDNVIVRHAFGDAFDDLAHLVVIDTIWRPKRSASSSVLADVTLQYLAPELTLGADADARADLYALGALMYECLTGRVPFDGRTVSEIIGQKRSKSFPKIGDYRRDAPSALTRLVDQLLAPHPEHRPPSAAMVIATLSQILDAHRPLARGRRPSRSMPSFVGRGGEVLNVVEALTKRSREKRASTIDVAGPPGSGVTSFLREVHDRLETHGASVLVMRPKSVCGMSVVEQLSPAVQKLVRRQGTASGEVVEPAQDYQAPKNTTELLDDLWIASRSQRVVLIVDDAQLCDAEEVRVLKRIALQAGALEGEWPKRDGSCVLLLGHDGGRLVGDEVVSGLSVMLEPLSAADIVEIARRSFGRGDLGLGEAERIRAETGGWPGGIMAALAEAVGHENRLASGDETSTTRSNQGEGGPLLGELKESGDFKALAALACWGEWLGWDEWRALRLTLGRAHVHDDSENERWLVRREFSGTARVRFRFPEMARALKRALSARDRAQIGRQLLRATWRRWRSDRLDDVRSCLPCAARMGMETPRLRWAILRVLLVLLDAGHVDEVLYLLRGAAEEAVEGRAPKWLPALRRAAAARKGRARRVPSAGGGAAVRTSRAFEAWRCLAIASALGARGRGRRAMALLGRSSQPMPRDGVCRVPARACLETAAFISAEVKEREALRHAAQRLGELIRRAWRDACPKLIRTATAPGDLNGGSLGPRERHLCRSMVSWLRARRELSILRGKFVAAAAAARREERLWILLHRQWRVAACLNNQGVLYLRAGNLGKATDYLERAARVQESLGEEDGVAETLINLAFAMTLHGDFSSAAATLNRARTIAERNGLQGLREKALLNLAVAYHRGGQLASARRAYRTVIKCARRAKSEATWITAVSNYILVLLDRWNVGAAMRLNKALQARIESAKSPTLAFYPARIMAELALRSGDWERLSALLGKRPSPPVAHGALDEYYAYALAVAKGDREATRGHWQRVRRMPRIDRISLRMLTYASGATLLREHSARRIARLATAAGAPRLALVAADTWLMGLEHTEADHSNVEWCLALLESRAAVEGFEDLHVSIRARLAAVLGRGGRRREGRGLALESVRRLDRLSRRVGCAEEFVPILRRLRGLVLSAFGFGEDDAGSGKGWSMEGVKSRAFDALAGESIEEPGRWGGARERLLREVACALEGEEDVGATVARLLRAALDVTGAERAAVLTRGPDGERRIRSAVARDGKAVAGESDISWAVVSAAFESVSASLYSDALAAAELASHRSVAALRLRSLACVPFAVDARERGVLYLEHRHVAGLFVPEDVSILTLLAAAVGSALRDAAMRSRLEAAERGVAEARDQLIRTERSRLAAQLTAGVAHDLKNLSATISARAQLVRPQATDDAVRSALKAIEQAAYESAGLVDRLQDCTRDHSAAEEEVVDVGQVAAEALELAAPRFAGGRGGMEANIEVKRDIAAGACVRAVPAELRELFLNLVVNACDAMPSGGTLCVEVGEGPDGDSVCIVVRDTGIGMSSDVKKRAFEPFFTTKGRRGTGLGLAVVRSIVVRYGGQIEVESEVGRGTTFRISLPRVRPNER